MSLFWGIKGYMFYGQRADSGRNTQFTFTEYYVVGFLVWCFLPCHSLLEWRLPIPALSCPPSSRCLNFLWQFPITLFSMWLSCHCSVLFAIFVFHHLLINARVLSSVLFCPMRLFPRTFCTKTGGNRVKTSVSCNTSYSC